MEDRRRGAEQGVRFPVRFNDAWWRRDLIASDPEGRAAARRAGERWERDGVAPDELRAGLAEGPDGPIHVPAHRYVKLLAEAG